MTRQALIGATIGLALTGCASFGAPATTQTVANDATAAVTDTSNVVNAVTQIAADIAKAAVAILPALTSITTL